MIIVNQSISPGLEPIAGYVLEELIGCGGFGEVWRASAPGGMKKAIKFVYGNINEKRTEQELKSLERIKSVQHPFILGLERFEVINGQLVVVTELADGSLEDIVRQHRERGSCGIPRESLLSYMRDVADALDYLHQLYQLQHLDIKPANLLIVGGRIKVADFGLLKDLQDIHGSVVGGLTPIYAPPEVFDGKPSLHSDQYSMAVMYQELLTGSRPFNGRTIAQLATEHVHNAPDLTPLPPIDRPVIARALEKSFDRRYGSCSEFVDALNRPRGSTKSRSFDDSGTIDDCDTKSVGESFVAGVGQTQVKDLPDLNSAASDLAAEDQRFAPAVNCTHALVIALGGTGAECLDDLLGRLENPGLANKPTLHTVFLDTDESTARSLRRYKASENLAALHSIAVPLRTSNDYRDAGMARLHSMSRRWIYNVPRSGRTEGMRPLGRLALIDHCKSVCKALQEAIQSVKQNCGNQIPSVYIVGSVAGGTGGGMYLDIAHVLRSMLDDGGLEQTSILSLLATSKLEAQADHPLALHDTSASLREIRHFLSPNHSYPGDEFAKLPTLPSARSPLKNVYLIAAHESPDATPVHQTIADYLWFDATVGRELLHAARQQVTGKTGSFPVASLRSVGVVRLSQGTFSESILAPAATRILLARWLGNPANAKTNAAELVGKIQTKCQLDHQSFYTSVLERFGESSQKRQNRILDHFDAMSTNELADPTVVVNSLNPLFAQSFKQEHNQTDVELTVNTINHELRRNLRLGRLDMICAIETVRSLSRDVRLWEAQLDRQAKDCESNANKILSSNDQDQPATASREPLTKLACHVGEIMLESYANRAAAARADLLCKQLAVIESRLSDAATLLARAVRATNTNLSDTNQNGTANPWDLFSSPLATQVAPYLADLHNESARPWLVNLVSSTDHITSPDMLVAKIKQIARPLIQQSGPQASPSPPSTSTNTNCSGTSTPSGLNTESKDLVPSNESFSQSLSRSTLLDGLGDANRTGANNNDSNNNDSNNGDSNSTIAQALSNARPRLLGFGGQQRLILVAGTNAELDALRSDIEQVHDGKLTCVLIPTSAPMLIHEAQQIAIDDVLARLSTLTGGQSKVSDRLLTRIDIPYANRRPD